MGSAYHRAWHIVRISLAVSISINIKRLVGIYQRQSDTDVYQAHYAGNLVSYPRWLEIHLCGGVRI